MFVIESRNVHSAVQSAIRMLEVYGIREESRNGGVTVLTQPLTTRYSRPTERVIGWPQRKANPFFHFIESLWMLNGSNDVRTLSNIVPRMTNFSDDGETFHGAYGHRWRRHFGFDQILMTIQMLKADPNSRRAYISMWDPFIDLGRNSRDIPCNLGAAFRISKRADETVLDMTVFNRSNDLIWGAYGANAVHFSYLQEFVALSLGLKVGYYWQVSNNAHIYDDIPGLPKHKLRSMIGVDSNETCLYAGAGFEPYPLIRTSPEAWLKELKFFLEEPNAIGFNDPFFRRVAKPIFLSHQAYRKVKDPDRYKNAIEIVAQCAAKDWQFACIDWIKNQQAAKTEKEEKNAANSRNAG